MLPGGWIFRGHSDDNFSLVPTALRANSKELLDLTLGEINNTKDQQWSENRVLADFLQVADSIGLHIPEDTQKLRRSFESGAEKPDLWPPDDVLSLMALAQHHGVPTRLLDWSRHPLKAALFAASGAVEIPDKSGRLSVWALSLEMLDMLSDWPKPFTVVTAPAATNSNLRAQEGVFTLALHVKIEESPVDRTPFDEILRMWAAKYAVKVQGGGPWFHHVTLPRSEADQLGYDLALEGITRARLFPDFYGVAKAMRDAARWQVDGGPGAKRVKERIKSFSMSYETTVHVIRPPGFTGPQA